MTTSRCARGSSLALVLVMYFLFPGTVIGLFKTFHCTEAFYGSRIISPVGLLVLILTEPAGAARRAWQRATWLRFRWHEAQLSQMAVPWRHVYVQGRTADSVEAALDVVHAVRAVRGRRVAHRVRAGERGELREKQHRRTHA